MRGLLGTVTASYRQPRVLIIPVDGLAVRRTMSPAGPARSRHGCGGGDPDRLAAGVRAAQAGDTLAMNALLDELGPYVLRICRSITLSDAEDAAQETLTLVFRRLGKLQQPEAIRAWVRTIAVREAVRSAHRRQQAGVPSELPDKAAEQVDVDLSLDIRRQLTQLPPEQRAVLVLRELEGLSEDEVAQLLRVPQGTVKSRLHRARRRFVEGWSR
jgi:RNA polymerase sigma factor (sigma-70 family)